MKIIHMQYGPNTQHTDYILQEAVINNVDITLW
jgi:hypothetical protein